MTASYRPGLPPVLRNLSFSLQPGTSCGVVGRTGAALCSDPRLVQLTPAGVRRVGRTCSCLLPLWGPSHPSSCSADRHPGVCSVPCRVPVSLLCLPGSGKSSLMLSLYRLIDINMGSVVLDGVDTASLALDCLRKQLAIIPQVGVVLTYMETLVFSHIKVG